MNLIALSFVLVYYGLGASGQDQRDFDINSCRVQLSCGGSPDTNTMPQDRGSVAGLPGKRGPQGVQGRRGPVGQKGAKGEPCNCTAQLSDIEEQLRAVTSKNCPQTKYKFPRSAQTSDFIRVKVPIQRITAATVCSWITPPSSGIKGSFFSYATNQNFNAFLLHFVSTKKCDLVVNDVGKSYTFPSPVTTRMHLCVAFAQSDDSVKLFVNGGLRIEVSFPNIQPIDGGGAFLLGQEQDSFLGTFDGSQAFSGTFENFMMWYRALDHREINSLYNDRCSCPTDYAVALTPNEIQLEGKVTALPVDQC